jgi:patatin-like phospholipase/acyl hydrolase
MRRSILAISGGGYLGLFAARYLEHFETGGNTIGSRFDFIAGTSIGGIIALGLASGASATIIRKALESQGRKIFPFRRRVLFGLTGAKYRPGPLRKAIKDIVGDKKMGDLDVPTIIPSFNLLTGQVRIFRSNHWKDSASDADISLVDVALATSAAPTFFPPHPVGDGLYVDGGMFANAPDILAIIEATRLYDPSSTFYLLSVGTTNVASALPAKRRRWGLVSWLRRRRLITLVMESQAQISRFGAQRTILPENILVADTQQGLEQAPHLQLDRAGKNATTTLNALADAAFARDSRQSGELLGTLQAERHGQLPMKQAASVITGSEQEP